MLTENKFNKYLIYAICEIVLVVIGILIVENINNWKEERKFKTEEQKLPIDIMINFIQSHMLEDAEIMKQVRFQT